MQAEVAVAPRFLEFVVGGSRAFLVGVSAFVFEAEAVVKEAAADADGNRQPVGAELFAEDAAARRREFVVAVLVFAALGEDSMRAVRARNRFSSCLASLAVTSKAHMMPRADVA